MADVDQPAFKRRKRPQGAASRPRDSPTPAPADDSPASTAPADHDTDDTTSETLEELLALRRLKRSTAGLELDRLNSGERKKRPKSTLTAGAPGAPADGDGTVLREDGSVEGTRGGIRHGGAGNDRLRDDSEAPEARARKIIKTDNFTGQTNTVDVDKHMLAYIDAELAKRRNPSSTDPSDPSSSYAAGPSKPLDPRDELYRVAERYQFADVAAQEKSKKARDDDEGNVTLSASMLMGIPEVDLGIDTKLKNIEATELAKRQLHEQQAARRQAARDRVDADDMVADR
ncbi:telomere length and silencing 1 family protein, partial [Rhodotorula paludigena]|uniref:telomere length and silencing 1 family protein n=1 Tax=Rhodotorula paludigena TaxID=86838 RepID=UPI00316B02D8